MKYLIMHGHFYQPPRENPFLGVITREPSANPAHDWNERITNECYSPNAYSRILDNFGRIVKMVNNYSYLSFNFGPTLLDYIASERPHLLKKIVEADKESISRLGYGNAIAQVYNHIILPLANKEDMKVQIKWGLYNFEKYFGRKSSGIWLSETAINLDVVDALCECGVKYTILSPFQAKYIKQDNGQTIDVSGNRIDSSKPYWLYGHNGQKIAVFFYEGDLSKAIAFDHLLMSSDKLADRIRSSYIDKQMVNIATDGESYGHHEAFGDMCISYYFNNIVNNDHIMLGNYEHYLSICHPREEVILHDGEGNRGTSWSCSHGVERWRSDCGCGAREGWNLKWREPLREAFNVLRDLEDTLFKVLIGLTDDTRENIRADYVRAIYDKEAIKDLYEICKDRISLEDFSYLMESYKYSLFSFTSCGWFFDDVSRIEPKQNMQYAERAFYFARSLSDKSKDRVIKYIDEAYALFLEKLSLSISNEPPNKSAKVYYLESQKVDLYSELYSINEFAFNTLYETSEHISDTINNFEITVEKREYMKAEGFIKSTYGNINYFKYSIYKEHDIYKNAIKMAKSKDDVDKTDSITLTYKDIISDRRSEIADYIFASDIQEVQKQCNNMLPHFEKIFNFYNANDIIPNYDYRRIMGSLYSPVLRAEVESLGKVVYPKITEILSNMKKADIFVSTSGIAITIANRIKAQLIEIIKTNNTKLLNDILDDVKFLSNNNMPSDRHTLENLFYIMASEIKNGNIKLEEKDRNKYIELGNWLNFNMDFFKV